MLRAGLQAANHLVDLVGRCLGAMRKVAHLVGHYRKTASGFTRAGGFDGGVEGQQVGLLRDAFDDIKNVTDVFGAGVELLDLRAGITDLGRQRAHGVDGFLDHYLTVFSLVAGLTGLDRGVRCVAGNLLGCSTQLVDRCSDVVGSGTLLIETDDGRVGGVDHPLRQVMHLKRR